MSTGVLIYSFDTATTSYSKLTERCVRHIRHHLDLPITVVSEQAEFQGVNNIHVTPSKNNRRLYNGKVTPWHNEERVKAYDHSPYDNTILMDCDYFVLSDHLLGLGQTVNDLLLHTRLNDVTGRQNIFHTRESLVPLVWATVIIFKKNNFVGKIFQLAQHVQQHYQYYRNLYRISHIPYRNDYAFAIALHQMYGQHSKDYGMPTSMNMIGKHGKVTDLTMDSMTFRWDDKWSSIQNQDIHVFDKEFFDV